MSIGERASQRASIRDMVGRIGSAASAELSFEEGAAHYTLEILEQLTLAVCNVAETLDAGRR